MERSSRFGIFIAAALAMAVGPAKAAEFPGQFLDALRQSDALVALGRLSVEEAAQWAPGSADRKKRLQSARESFIKAQKGYAEIKKQSEESLRKLGFVDPADLKKCHARDRLRREQLQAGLAWIRAHQEIAGTYEADTVRYRQILRESAAEFAELHEQQGDQLGGLYARLGEASCYQALGEPRHAFAIFEGLLVWPDEPEAFRTLKTRAAVQALQTAILPGVKKYKEALDISEKWLQTANRDQRASPEGLAIRFLGAEAAMAGVQTLQGGGPEQAKFRDQCLREARENYTLVAAAAGPYQQKAKLRLLEPALASAPPRAPATFAEACDRLKAAMDRAGAAEAEVRLAAGKEVQIRRDCQQRLETTRQEAITYGRLALRLATREVSQTDLDAARYELAYLLLTSGDLEEAAVLGEFLAGHAEGAPGGEGAKIALAAYHALFHRAPETDAGRQARLQVLHLANSVVKRGSTHPAADDARIVLLEAAVADGRLDEARQHLDAIPVGSPRRGEAELGLGQALWTAYRAEKGDGSNLPHGGPEAGPASREPHKLDLSPFSAEQLLKDGMARTRSAVGAGQTLSGMAAAGSLAMAEISLDAGRFDEAVERLEDLNVGAKTLVDTRDRAAGWGDFPAETYRAALRVYVAAGQEEEAEGALVELENLASLGDAANAPRRLTQTAIRLGRDVADQTGAFRRQATSDLLARWVRAMNGFLTRMAGSREQASFFRLDAVAEAYYGLGAGLDPRSAEAQEFYRRAAEAFRSLLGRCGSDKTFAPQPEAVTAVRVRLAQCLRRSGKYAEALAVLQAVLKEHPTMVDAQVEAAYTYQGWGAESPDHYGSAIQGEPSTREVWGWAELSRRVESVVKYRDVFFEARYNLALCRFRHALAQADLEGRRRELEAARQDILVLGQLHGDPGGKSWQDQYNELLRQIEQAIR